MKLAAFYNQIRHSLFGGKLTQGQVEGINAILHEFHQRGLTDKRWLAYILATAKHETSNTMQPIEEYGKGKGRKYGSKIKMSGQPYEEPDKIYYGRGHVQLTWYENYERMGNELGVDLLHKPEMALYMDVSVKVLFIGMIKGMFTGAKLKTYFNDDSEDWINARKIVNGLDKAQLIAGYGKKFYKAILNS